MFVKISGYHAPNATFHQENDVLLFTIIAPLLGLIGALFSWGSTPRIPMKCEQPSKTDCDIA